LNKGQDEFKKYSGIVYDINTKRNI